MHSHIEVPFDYKKHQKHFFLPYYLDVITVLSVLFVPLLCFRDVVIVTYHSSYVKS